MRQSDKLMAFLGDLEPTHIFIRNVFKTGEPRTSKMCPKHSKYAVGCKVGFLQKSHQKGRPGLHFGGLWGHFGALWPPNGIPEAIL